MTFKKFKVINVSCACWIWYDLNVIVFEPVLGLFAGMLGVIVLLEGDVRESFAKMTDVLETVLEWTWLFTTDDEEERTSGGWSN